MMTSTSYSTPPPTTNNLPRSQRTRLLKSSRKVEAVLGTTPFVLKVDVGKSLNDVQLSLAALNGSQTSKADSRSALPRPPVTPRTRAQRRRGTFFGEFPSSGSDDSGDEVTLTDKLPSSPFSDAGSFVIISSNTPRGTYQTQNIPAAVSAQPRTRKKSHIRNKSDSKTKFNKAKPLPPMPSVPIHVGLPLVGEKEKQDLVGVPVPPSHPVMLYYQKSPTSPSHSRSFSLSSVATTTQSSSRRFKAFSITSFNSSILSPSGSPMSAAFPPLSPISSVFSMTSTTSLSPEELKAKQEKEKAKQDKEREMKRKKLAKVMRTLGENVPPELVFPNTTKKLSASSRPRSSVRRASRRASIASRSSAGTVINITAPVVDISANSQSFLDLTPLVTEVSLPPVLEVESPVKTTTPVKDSPATSKPRKHRPRSLSVPIAFPPSNVVVESEELQPQSTSQPRLQSTSLPNSHTPSQTTPNRPRVTRRRVAGSLDSPHGRMAFSNLVPAAPSAPSSFIPVVSGYPRVVRSSGTQNAKYPVRGTSSLDIDRSSQRHPQSHSHSRSSQYPYPTQANTRSPADYVWGRRTNDGDEVADWGRRKEKEWSGEWNVQDIGDVVKKLRDLKTR